MKPARAPVEKTMCGRESRFQRNRRTAPRPSQSGHIWRYRECEHRIEFLMSSTASKPIAAVPVTPSTSPISSAKTQFVAGERLVVSDDGADRGGRARNAADIYWIGLIPIISMPDARSGRAAGGRAKETKPFCPPSTPLRRTSRNLRLKSRLPQASWELVPEWEL